MLPEAFSNFTSPPVLFFALGLIFGLIKADLHLPKGFSKILALYLMMAIGFKGGVELSESVFTWNILSASLLGVGFSLALPFVGYGLLRISTDLRRIDCVAVAAHYGSVSIVTFVAALAFLDSQRVDYQQYLLFLLVLMEAPALFSAFFLKRWIQNSSAGPRRMEWREIFLSGSILLLLGSLVIGLISGPAGKTLVGDFLITPFNGVLCIFLLEMGMTAGRNLVAFRKAGFALVLFGIYMPVLSGVLALMASRALGFDVGSMTLFAVLSASASYIVVPSALKVSMPEANSALYVPMALGVTFPFNILVGIPLYYQLALTIDRLSLFSP